MRIVLFWSWRRIVRDPARVLVCVALLVAAVVGAALPLTATATLTSALRVTLGAAGIPVTRADPVVLRFSAAPGTARPSWGVWRRLVSLAAGVSRATGIPAGQTAAAALTLPWNATLLSAGRPRRLGAVRLGAVTGWTGQVRGVVGGPPPRGPVGPRGLPLLQASVSRGFALAQHLAPGAILEVEAPTGVAAGPALHLRVASLFAVPAASAFWPFPMAPPTVLVPFPLLARLLAQPAAPQVADLWAETGLDLSALRPAGVAHATAGLGRLAAQAERVLPGTTLVRSPRGPLLAYGRRWALWWRQLSVAALPALLAAIGTAALAGWLAAARDARDLASWLARGAAPGTLAALYLTEYLAYALPAAAAGPGLAEMVLHVRAMAWTPTPVVAWPPPWSAYGGSCVVTLAGLAAALAPAWRAVARPVAALAWGGAPGLHGAPQHGSDGARSKVAATVMTVVVCALVLCMAAGDALYTARAVRDAAQAALAGARPWLPLSVQPPATVLLPAALLISTCFALVWGLRALARIVEATRAPRRITMLLAWRRLSRLSLSEAAAAALVAMAVGSGIWAWSAVRSFRLTTAHQAAFAVGAPWRIQEQIPAACTDLVRLDGLHCLRDGVEVSTPRAAAGQSPPWLLWPVPPGPNRGLPGVAAASSVFSLFLPAWPQGSASARLVLVDPRTYGRVVLWPPGLPGSLPTALRALVRAPGTLLVADGAASEGLGPGVYDATFPCLVYAPDCPPRVAAATASWPGFSPSGPPLFVGALHAAGPVPDLAPPAVIVTPNGFAWRTRPARVWPLAPLTVDELLRLKPGAEVGPILQTLRRRGVRVRAITSPAAVIAIAQARPTARGQLLAWAIDMRAAAAFAGLGLALTLLWAARRRAADDRLLRTLGIPPRCLCRAAWLEGVALAVACLWAGVLAGAFTAQLSVPWLLRLSPAPSPVAPALVLPVAWPLLGGATMVAALAGVLALVVWTGDTGPRAGHGRERLGPLLAPLGHPPSLAECGGVARTGVIWGLGGASWRARGREGSARVYPARLAGWFTQVSALQRAAVLLACARWRAAPREAFGLALALTLAAGSGAAVPLAASSALSGLLAAALVPQDGRPAGAVLLLQNAAAAGGAVRPDAIAALARIADALPSLTGLRATPTVTVQETGTFPLYAERGGQPVGAQPLAMAEMEAQPGLAGHVRWVVGGGWPATAAGGVIPAVAATTAARGMGLTVGDVYDLEPSPGYGPPVVAIRLVGVFTPVSPHGAFWPYRDLSQGLFVSPAALAALATAYPRLLSLITAYRVLDVSGLLPARAAAVAQGLATAAARVDLPGGGLFQASPLQALRSYLGRAAVLRLALLLLALPAWVAAALLALLAAREAARAWDGEGGALGLRGGGLIAARIAEGGIVACAGCVAVLVGTWLAAWVAAVATAPATTLSARVGRLVQLASLAPTQGAWQGAVLAVAAVALAAVAARGTGALANRHARRSTGPWWGGLVGAGLLGAALWGESAVRARLAAGEPGWAVAAPVVGFIMAPVAVWGVALLLLALGRVAAAVSERRWSSAMVPRALLVFRRLARSPGDWAVVWMVLVFALAQGYAVAGTVRSLRLQRQAQAGLTVGAASAAVTEGWPNMCQPLDASPPGGGTASAPRYERYLCTVRGKAWGGAARGVFGYQLPAPPPAPFSVNGRLPGVLAATPLLELDARLGVPGGAVTDQAEIVGVDPATYRQAAWWRAGINPLPLRAYLAGMRQGEVFVSAAWLAVRGLRVGEWVEVRLDGRTLPLRIGGTVRLWPGVSGGPLLVADAIDLVRDFSLKPLSYQALLRLRPGVSPSGLQPALTARGLFIVDVRSVAGMARADAADPGARGLEGLLVVAGLVLAAAGAFAFLLLVRRVPCAKAEAALLFALGVDRTLLVAAAAAEVGIAALGATVGGIVAGALAEGLIAPLLRSLAAVGGSVTGAAASGGAGLAVGAAGAAGAAPFVTAAPGAATVLLALLTLAVGYGWARQALTARVACLDPAEVMKLELEG